MLHMSSRGVVHRDLKLENLVVSKETQLIKLIDFGNASFLKDSLSPKKNAS
jgi:serine/threonine protein kinase